MSCVSQAWRSYNRQRICCLFFWICCCFQHSLKRHPYNNHHINYQRPALFPSCHFDSDACTQKKPHSQEGLWGNGFYGFCLGGRTWRTMLWLITYHFSHICQQKNEIKNKAWSRYYTYKSIKWVFRKGWEDYRYKYIANETIQYICGIYYSYVYIYFVSCFC